MGNKNPNMSDCRDKPDMAISKNHFDMLYVVGRGGFGKVWKVMNKKSKKQYAFKEMLKARIIDKKSEKSIQYEKELLSQINHPFIVNMNYAFQDSENLYIVLDLLSGGDLRYHISIKKKFTEEQTKFFAACIILGLDYIHTNNILHRDIKPENLVLDERGYVRITDFGIAKFYQKENSSETSGTPGYMAPEVMCGQNHTIAVDYFALGVIVYEFMCGVRPYTGKTRKDIKEKIMAKQVQIKGNEVPTGWSIEAADFINRLLQRKAANRLGLRGASELKEHSWLKYYNWKDLYDKKLEAPYSPKVGDNFDARYCNAPEKIGNITRERYEQLFRDEKIKAAFKDFFYSNENEGEDKQNTKGKKFFNPHLNITNNKELKNGLKSLNITFSNIIQNNLNSKSMADKMININKMDSNLSKIKMVSSNVSNNTLLRNRILSSGNVISNSSTLTSNSATNFTYNQIINARKSGSNNNQTYIY